MYSYTVCNIPANGWWGKGGWWIPLFICWCSAAGWVIGLGSSILNRGQFQASCRIPWWLLFWIPFAELFGRLLGPDCWLRPEGIAAVGLFGCGCTAAELVELLKSLGVVLVIPLLDGDDKSGPFIWIWATMAPLWTSRMTITPLLVPK